MFENLFNILIVIVAIVVFVVRSFLQVKASKKAATQKRPKPAPAIFKKDDDEEPYRDLAYYVELEEKKAKEEASANAAKKKVVSRKAPPVQRVVKDVNISESIAPKHSPATFPVIPIASSRRSGRRSGISGLKHLSPLKQAVVMAEVLGSPKALK